MVSPRRDALNCTAQRQVGCRLLVSARGSVPEVETKQPQKLTCDEPAPDSRPQFLSELPLAGNRIPFNAPTATGTFTVTATSSGACVTVASLALTVRAPAGAIPATGSNASGGLQLGGIAIGIGAALIGLASFRRRHRLVAA